MGMLQELPSRSAPGALYGRFRAGTFLARVTGVEKQPPKLLDQARDRMRARHFSRRTEETYIGWIRRYIGFTGLRHPRELGAAEISAFLSWLAVRKRVSASTQNQPLSALLFLYRQLLGIDVGPIDSVVRARTPERLPVVLGREEVRTVLAQLDGTMWLIVALLYGAGLRLGECLELRVKDIDLERRQIVVRRGKGQKDRVTVLPLATVGRLTDHLQRVRLQHDRDRGRGLGRAVLPFALERKYPNAAPEWVW